MFDRIIYKYKKIENRKSFIKWKKKLNENKNIKHAKLRNRENKTDYLYKI